MTAKTAKALEESIAHWARMAVGTMGDKESIFSKDCPLYKLYLDKGCIGCPVSKNTGHWMCRKTPWQAAHDSSYEGYNTPEFRAAAMRQLAFLKSLRKSKKRTHAYKD